MCRLKLGLASVLLLPASYGCAPTPLDGTVAGTETTDGGADGATGDAGDGAGETGSPDTGEATGADGGDGDGMTGAEETETGDGDSCVQPGSGIYAMCLTGEECDSTDVCLGRPDATGQIIDGHCTNPCLESSQCVSVGSCSARPECVTLGGGEQVCILNCGGGGTCPDGMECVDGANGAVQYCV